MFDFLSQYDSYDFSATPNSEPCAQTGSIEYDALKNQRIEIQVFKEKILREVGEPPKGFIRWKIVSNPHDFGDYLTLQIQWDDFKIDDDKWWDYINEIDAIDTWEQQDLQRLIELGYETEKILGEDRIWKAPMLR